MGLGPDKSSLLSKLGRKQAWEMPDDELQAIVAKDQHRRTVERAMGRAAKAVVADDDGEGIYHLKKVGRPRTKSRVKGSKKIDNQQQTLESLGMHPDICKKLRAGGKPDWQLILELQGAGII